MSYQDQIDNRILAVGKAMLAALLYVALMLFLVTTTVNHRLTLEVKKSAQDKTETTIISIGVVQDDVEDLADVESVREIPVVEQGQGPVEPKTVNVNGPYEVKIENKQKKNGDK